MLAHMNWTQWVTFGIAIVGATLGVFNAYWMIRRDAIRLRVRYVSLYIPSADTWTAGVAVTNLGSIAVTITEVAIRGGALGNRRIVVQEDFFRRHGLPLRMEPRTEATIAAEPSFLAEVRRWGATHCSASTACGVVVKARIRGRRD